MKILKKIKNIIYVFYFNIFYKKIKICKSSISLSSQLQFEKNASVHIERGFVLNNNSFIRVRNSASLFIGENCFFNNGCIITCREKVTIGNYAIFGPNVLIFDHDHNYKSKDRKNNFISSEIKIGNNVWIGGNCCILKGSDIGDNCVIAAGAIVNGKVSPNTIYYSKDKTKKIGECNE